MRLHVAKPDAGKANGGGIMVFQEAFGVNDHVRDLAGRFADLGLVAVAPELFHRGGPGVVLAYDDIPAVMKFMGENVTREGLVADILATAAWMNDEAKIPNARLASVGYCMGGRVSFTANAHVPLAAAIGYYGGLAPASLDLVDKQHGPLLLFWAGLDANIRPEGTRAAADALSAAKKDYVEVIFAQADHGFFCDARPAVYNAAASRQAWALTKEFLAVHGVL
jgi:carboxymethylenebutenolidase